MIVTSVSEPWLLLLRSMIKTRRQAGRRAGYHTAHSDMSAMFEAPLSRMVDSMCEWTTQTQGHYSPPCGLSRNTQAI